jgi:hypothetical protein
MNPRTYIVDKNKIEIDDPKVLGIIEDAEKKYITYGEAVKRLSNYYLSNIFTCEHFMKKYKLWEAIVVSLGKPKKSS